MHVLRDLKTLEQRFPNELVVIGVHSPKFTNEKDPDNLKRDPRALRDRASRRQRRQPRDLAALRRQGVADARHHRSRPAISSAPRWAKATSKDSSARSAPWCASSTNAASSIDRRCLSISSATVTSDRPLLYPGKVLADERSGSPLHRRLEPQPHRRHDARRQVDRNDRLRAAGRQRRHLPAGALLSAAGPRASIGDLLYVADTENHQIRVVDFQARAVHTLAGTGKQARVGR